jgi:hypothetical protein
VRRIDGDDFGVDENRLGGVRKVREARGARQQCKH